jgi:DUF1009 family protein
MERIGLIAGSGKFPILLAQEAKKKDYSVVALGIKGDTSKSLVKFVDTIHWIKVSEFRKIFNILQQEGIKKAIMAGQVNPRHIFKNDLSSDPELSRILSDTKDKKADTIFGAIAERFNASGIELLDSTLFLVDYLPKRGILTRRKPNFREWEDIYFGFEMAKAIAFLDIGQTIAVKDKVVLAVEAFEGTNLTVRRAGKLTKGNIVIVKVSKPQQDKRFDIPVIGRVTLRAIIMAKASCLAMEAGKTLLLDKEDCILLADRHDIAMVAV